MIPYVTQKSEEDVIKDCKYYMQKLANKYHYSSIDDPNLTKMSKDLNDIVEQLIKEYNDILSDSVKEYLRNTNMIINSEYVIYVDRYLNLITDEIVYTNTKENIDTDIPKKPFTKPELNTIEFLDVIFYELARQELSGNIDNLYLKFIKIKEIFDECVEKCYYTKEMLEETKKYDFVVNIGENVYHIKYDNVYSEKTTLIKVFG